MQHICNNHGDNPNEPHYYPSDMLNNLRNTKGKTFGFAPSSYDLAEYHSSRLEGMDTPNSMY